MISFQVNYGPAFSEVTKKAKETLQFDKEIELNELLNKYYKQYGAKFKQLIWKDEIDKIYHDQLVIIINGRSYRDENFLKTLLKNGDEIFFLFEYFGG